MPQSKADPRLHGTWWRVPEQDKPGQAVYLKEGAPLTPARGRHGFTLHADGTATLHGPGPDDRSANTESRWHLDAQGQLHVEGSGDAAAAIAELADNRLTLRR